jgi:hypothetical protein
MHHASTHTLMHDRCCRWLDESYKGKDFSLAKMPEFPE